MKIQAKISFVVVSFLLCLVVAACRPKVEQIAEPVIASAPETAQKSKVRTDIGFRTRRNLEEHYEKHGREFGSITQDEYLRQAQTLRDQSVGGDILEATRNDGVITRFNRNSGAFLAFNKDLTIRTYFRPNDGERYFNRQLKR